MPYDQQCNHQLVTDHLYDYIDDKLSPTLKKQVESAINQCDTCQQVFQQAISVQQASHQWQEQSVPEWHRTDFAVRPKPSAFGWINLTALATSTLAILMVLFQVNISTNDSGLHIAFGNPTDKHIDALVEQKITAYQKQQDTLLEARLLAQSEKIKTSSQLSIANSMQKMREERRDDLSFLITGIQTQRFEDQSKVDKQLAYLAENQIENNQYLNQLIQSKNLSNGEK